MDFFWQETADKFRDIKHPKLLIFSTQNFFKHLCFYEAIFSNDLMYLASSKTSERNFLERRAME